MKYPRCEQKRHDCFGCDENGCCVVLRDTKFETIRGKKYKCPFYKTVLQAGTSADAIKEGDYKDDE